MPSEQKISFTSHDQTSSEQKISLTSQDQEQKNPQKEPENPSQRWLVLAGIVIGMIVFTIVLVTALPDKTLVEYEEVISTGKKFGFDDIFDGPRPRYGYMTWIQDANQSLAVSMEPEGIMVRNPVNPALNEILVSNNDLCIPDSPLKCVPNATISANFEISPDLNFILFKTNVQRVYRHSSLAVYIVFDIQNKQFFSLAEGALLRYAVWSPNPDHHFIAYVSSQNNIYVIDIDLKTSTQITDDGVINSVINGVCDWVYEEEVFSQTNALWWAPDGKTIAYLKFKENRVREYEFSIYDIPYNLEYVYKYPKAGENNSIVSLWLYSIDNDQTRLPNLSIGEDDYFIEVTFFNSHQLIVKTMPRLQNSWKAWSINTTTQMSDFNETGIEKPHVTLFHSETHPQYLEPHHTLLYISKHSMYVDIMVVDGFDHIVLFDALSGAKIREITHGPYEIKRILGYSPSMDALLFISTPIASKDDSGVYETRDSLISISQGVYMVGLDGEDAPQLITCLNNTIAELDTQIEDMVWWDEGNLSPLGDYLLLTHHGDLHKLDTVLCHLNNIQTAEKGAKAIGNLIDILQDNTKILESLNEFALPTRSFVEIDGTIDKNRGVFYYPPNFDDSCGQKYPVLIYAYSGPGSQQVNARFYHKRFETFLSSSHNYIIFIIDTIGTGGLGDKYKKAHTYMQLGVHEANDIRNAVQFLKSKCFVDNSQISFWGWSYGGFLSSMVAGFGSTSGLNKIIAVAPVTDWRLYDTIYTERYMRTPQNNMGGYLNGSVLSRVSSFESPPKGPQYLIIHGSADDNVHFQNAAVLIEALVLKNIEFSAMYYPNRAHSLRNPEDGSSNKHLYRLLTDFLLD